MRAKRTQTGSFLRARTGQEAGCDRPYRNEQMHIKTAPQGVFPAGLLIFGGYVRSSYPYSHSVRRSSMTSR